MNIGEWLRKIIDEKDVSITKLADKSGVSRQSIYKILNSRSNCNFKTMCALCDAMDISLNEMVDRFNSVGKLVWKDDSMSPTICEDDIITINGNNKKIDNNGVYLINIDKGKQIIRRVLCNDMGVTLYADNPRCRINSNEMRILPKCDFEKMVAGKVVKVEREIK